MYDIRCLIGHPSLGVQTLADIRGFIDLSFFSTLQSFVMELHKLERIREEQNFVCNTFLDA